MVNEVTPTEEQTKALLAPGANDDLINYPGKGDEIKFETDDVRPPRLGLAQSNSPQVKRGNPKTIDGLREGDLFNDLTQQVYGEGPLEIVVIRYLGHRAMQFRDMKEGGGVIDFNVPLDDPRCQFTDGPPDPVTGKPTRVKPIATHFYDYLVWLPETSEIVALSMKGTSLKAAKDINSLVDQPLKLDGQVFLKPPRWARIFELRSAPKSDGGFQWVQYTARYKNVADPATRAICADLSKAYAGRNVVIDHEQEEGAGASDHVVDGAVVDDSDVPF